ncbi:MAG: sigma-70 family RNA polymerase sigma factor [Clostridia bacterium]|nr:sigma-70 family RNA polymerase sigma factor [Clostridia bacterium]
MKAMQSENVIGLLAQIRAGEGRAFDHLLSQYEPLIGGAIARYATGRSREDVEDLHQVAAMALYRAAMSYDLSRDEVKFGQYAKICVSNAIVSQLRSWKQNEEVLSLAQLQETASDEDLSTQVMADEASATLLARIRGVLSPYEWRVWTLYVAGYRSGEIARLLDKPSHSVENAVYRIRGKLRKELGDLR